MSAMKKQYVVVDIGNRFCKIGLCRGKQWLGTHRTSLKALPKIAADIKKQIHPQSEVTGLLCSVVPVKNRGVKQVLKKALNLKRIHVMLEDFAPPVPYPKTAGADRVANAYALFRQFGPCTVAVDFGTAITLDLVSKTGAFSGGIILPGVRTGLDAMGASGALLPHLEPRLSLRLIGKDTREAILSGVGFGIPGMIDHLVAAMEKELGYALVAVATGGDGKVLSRRSQRITAYRAHLTLEGIRDAYLAAVS